MDNPEHYSRASDFQKHDAREIVNEYAGKMNPSGKKSLLDMGCGSGDVLVKIIAPVLAEGFERITGVDVSPKMVNYCTKCYEHLEKVDFKVLDIESDHLPLEFHNQFDRVTSFNTLHWIQNHKKCLQNIFNSLRKGGDCLLVFVGSISIFDALQSMSSDPRWKECLKDLHKVFSPLFNHPQIEREYKYLLEEVGFREVEVEVKNKSFAYEGIDHFKDNLKAVHLFPVPASDYEDYFDAQCNYHSAAMGARERIPGTDDYRFTIKYSLVVAFARKAD